MQPGSEHVPVCQASEDCPTEHWLFSLLHTAQAFVRGKPNAGCGVSRRWSCEGDAIKGSCKPARF